VLRGCCGLASGPALLPQAASLDDPSLHGGLGTPSHPSAKTIGRPLGHPHKCIRAGKRALADTGAYPKTTGYHRGAMSPVHTIAVVSFNRNEERAVNQLLDDLLAEDGSPWTSQARNLIVRSAGSDEKWSIQHVPLRAQGNVMAAGQLASFFHNRRKAPDYVVFYGCCGAVREDHEASVFLVRHVTYVSLGTVSEDRNRKEQVTLKNKWLYELHPPAEVRPLERITFPLSIPGGGSLDLPSITGLPVARVASTDKVVHAGPTRPPTPGRRGLFPPDEWSYRETLALLQKEAEADPLLVDMESYGIARIASALDITGRVAVLRVTTDRLTNKAHANRAQAELTMRGRYALGHLLYGLFTLRSSVEVT